MSTAIPQWIALLAHPQEVFEFRIMRLFLDDRPNEARGRENIARAADPEETESSLPSGDSLE